MIEEIKMTLVIILGVGVCGMIITFTMTVVPKVMDENSRLRRFEVCINSGVPAKDCVDILD